MADASSISLRRRSSSRSNLSLAHDHDTSASNSLAAKDFDVKGRTVPGRDGKDDDEEHIASLGGMNEQRGRWDHENDTVD